MNTSRTNNCEVANATLRHLEEIAITCRGNAIDMAEACGSGHLGGSFSVMDILVALYYYHSNNNDSIIFSKAHCCEALYAVLGELEYFDKDLFKTFGEWGSPLQGHATKSTIGVEYSGGSLGQGLSYAVGKALAGKMRGDSRKVYCIIGDGECHEGQVWEAALVAAQYKLDNLVVIVDYNRRSSECESISEVVGVAPLSNKWKSFNWVTHIIMDGNDMDEIVYTLDKASTITGLPNCIIAHTVKGKGVWYWEDGGYHLMYGDVLKRGIKEWREAHAV